MLKKNCHEVLVMVSQKSKVTSLELIFQTAGTITPSPNTQSVQGKRSVGRLTNNIKGKLCRESLQIQLSNIMQFP